MKIRLNQGVVQGEQHAGLQRFLGIPYARSTRFAAPAVIEAGDALIDARQFGPAALQAAQDGAGQWRAQGSLDCLTLNIWAPAGSEALPVMLWLPGGGYIRGSASQALYDGAALAQRGMVVVSANYRLGAEGFLDLPGAPANRGLLDCLAALRWVQANIAAFGGDPQRVTLAGQSASAGAIALLRPQLHGLAQQVILQSPSTLSFTAIDAAIARRAIAAEAGCTEDSLTEADPAALAIAVARLSADSALRARHGYAARHRFALRPVGDRPLGAGWPARVLIGSTAEEARLYLVPNGDIDRITAAERDAFLSNTGQADPGGSPGEALCLAQTEFYYGRPTRDLALSASRQAQAAWRYLFAWRSPAAQGRLGAAHGVDLPFVFGTLDSPQGRDFAGDAAPAELSAQMQEAWSRFVIAGDPGWAPLNAGKATPSRCFS